MTGCAELHLRLWGVPVRLATMAAILRQGALASINPFCTLASVMVITAFIARLGTDVLAGYGIGARLELLLVPMIFGFGAASTVMVGVHFGANALDRGLRAGWTAALYSAALCGLVGLVVALFPGLWANLFSDAQAVRAACRSYLQIAGPFYAFYGLSLCLYFGSQGAGRVSWPVVASLLRVLVIAVGCVALARNPGTTADMLFAVIAAGLLVQGLITGLAIRLGAWTRGRSATAAPQPIINRP
jgi:Na+-driven multidrug efflux pump